ncbi:MAG: hypothetical protein P4L28_02100 [Paludibacteraceae bacterium]|nr:hypothetical protein [Paludibacteraceae bacterium]
MEERIKIEPFVNPAKFWKLSRVKRNGLCLFISLREWIIEAFFIPFFRVIFTQETTLKTTRETTLKITQEMIENRGKGAQRSELNHPC